MGRPQLVKGQDGSVNTDYVDRHGRELYEPMLARVQSAEEMGIDYILVAQRWWGTGQEMEASSYDCLAMTAFYAAHFHRINFITAIHPGFLSPAPIAKWGATIDRLTGGRWKLHVTSGWHEAEFGMYGAELLEHDERYARSTEFIQVMRGAWEQPQFSFEGRFYNVEDLRLEPRPVQPRLEVFQGGQSHAAMDMAARNSDWMFLNGGTPSKIKEIIESVRQRTAVTGRRVRFVMNATPLCRSTDEQAEAELASMLDSVDPGLLERRKLKVRGAEGMWSSPEEKITMLDTNEGYASRLIGSPDTIRERMLEFHHIGVDCFLLNLQDDRFNREVLPPISSNSHQHDAHTSIGSA